MLLCCGTHREDTQAAAVQLREGLAADVGDHVHGMVPQQEEPGLCENQEVLRLVLYLQTSTPHQRPLRLHSIKPRRILTETELCTLLFLPYIEIMDNVLRYCCPLSPTRMFSGPPSSHPPGHTLAIDSHIAIKEVKHQFLTSTMQRQAVHFTTCCLQELWRR